MLDTVLGTGDTVETRTDQVPVLMENASRGEDRRFAK